MSAENRKIPFCFVLSERERERESRESDFEGDFERKKRVELIYTIYCRRLL